jgi:sortase A
VTTTQESGDIIDLRPPRPDAPTGGAEAPVTAARIGAAPTVSVQGTRAPARQPVTRGSDAALIVSRGLATFSLLVAAMIAFLFVFSGFAEARSQVGLRRRFEHDIANLRAPIGGAISNGAPVAELDIAAIGLRQVVVQGTTSGVLRSGPGHLRQSPLPGQEGNAVIFGRRAAYGGPFRHLPSLSRGDAIGVWTGEGHRTYLVDKVRTVAADNGADLVSNGTDQLTLVTSDPAFVSSRRLVVSAHLQGKPYAPSADPTPVTRAELGLSGETDAVLPLALWLEVLLIVSLGTVWLFRRWARWSAYLVCVPIVFAAAWLVFENLTRLLPATL